MTDDFKTRMEAAGGWFYGFDIGSVNVAYVALKITCQLGHDPVLREIDIVEHRQKHSVIGKIGTNILDKISMIDGDFLYSLPSDVHGVECFAIEDFTMQNNSYTAFSIGETSTLIRAELIRRQIENVDHPMFCSIQPRMVNLFCGAIGNTHKTKAQKLKKIRDFVKGSLGLDFGKIDDNTSHIYDACMFAYLGFLGMVARTISIGACLKYVGGKQEFYLKSIIEPHRWFQV